MENELLHQILAELKELKTGQKALEAGQKALEAGQKTLEAGQKALEAGQKTTNERLDKVEQDNQHLYQMIEQQEKRIISQVGAAMEQQEKRIINQVNAIIETTVVPKIQLIAEQHSEIIEKLSVTKEVDSLKGRVSTLEGTVKTHTAQITELKKAQ